MAIFAKIDTFKIVSPGYMMNRFKSFITILAVFSFILWWGGFTFYASFVIPTGQKVLGGNHVLMGFITQDVAPKITYAALIACLLSCMNEWLRSGGEINLMSKFVIACLSLMLILIIALFILYPYLRDLLDPVAHKEIDHDRFYFLHRIYLLISSLLWLNGVVYIILLLKRHNLLAEQVKK